MSSRGKCWRIEWMPFPKQFKKCDWLFQGCQRIVGQDLRPIKDALDALDSERLARERFTREFRDFVTRLGGDVLTLKHDLFVRYFEQFPPFEVKKKSEFPDAASRLTLEIYARHHGTQGESSDLCSW